MFGTIGLWLLGKLSGINVGSVVQSAVTAYTAKQQAGTDQAKIDADLLAREVDLSRREAELQASLTATEHFGPRQLIGYGVAFFIIKVLVWDKCLHMGVTDPLDEHMWWVLTTTVVAYLGAATALDVVNKIRAR